MSRYILNVLAAQDLDEIADRFVAASVEAGERFFEEFDRKCLQLVTFPNSGRSYGTLRTGLRGLPLGEYIIFYRVLDDGIEILRVVSGRRDLPTLFEESGS
ncbi:type II toxin-antitoxin system RelE/ParE family toxin [Gloeobacter violaceus]|uniref:Gll1910 protein n=1 Tax=Gloeobacter violaceus (strain ATCC 29082 / PCC 7421) TaxID=251221 RepID=Q7NJC2_GLOVI|nr:type II toxin-antitoxin system RelE/ParE family toxin [Gloeobacter violaceus]BAC89851.1 gll1910 [Gloeobacter violaceus PCC 7421]